ncbi:hypothetical protein [Pelagicoccus sp. SDUM812002]|uniref:hypothetical protein n=1 Tax=Pelagicoccus sp. SDUM812002 TaxID=3041266 RepID=UPI00280FD56A|nr:hypothetical protein [Pelagicoccus sp. SDUM812002]MDQ8185511.1 hypothetical protein [Pelagicoccus sp. SDUM812002]
MSLINQALKLEQQKRQIATGPVAPMVHRMPHGRSSNKMPALLFAFTGLGLLFAASITAIFYFGADYLESENSLAASAPTAIADNATQSTDSTDPRSDGTSPKIVELLGSLSKDQLSTVQQMLIERKAGATAAETLDTSTSNSTEATVDLSERSRLQTIIDSYSVQGIRKSGRETRVFMNGKIRKIGDVIDIENRLRLIGFSETALIFADSDGNRFEKTL